MSALITTPKSSGTVSRVDEFLQKHYAAKPRVIVAFDATGSRQPTFDRAVQLQAEMFTAAAAAGLRLQGAYFRGPYQEFKATEWFDTAAPLINAMANVTCLFGTTAIEKVLRHAVREHAKEQTAALIYIGDMCEESATTLYAAAHELMVPAFLFQEGSNEYAAEIFGKIAEITRGAVAQFDSSSAAKLADLLRAVAAYASGGLRALEAQGSAAARLLLTQVKK